VELLKNRKDDILTENMDSLEQAIRVIWALAFDEENTKVLINLGAVPLIHGFKVIDHEGASEAIKNVLFKLEPPPSPALSAPDQLHPVISEEQIMISYCWAQKERMRDVADLLREQGYHIWIDIEQMEGSVLEKMAEAVENSSVIIIGLSSQYKESQACRTEAEYSYKLKKPMICLMAEDEYVPRGWLGALVGNQLWYSPWTHPGGFQAGVMDILKHIPKPCNPIIKEVPPDALNVAPTTPSSSSSSSSSNRTKSAAFKNLVFNVTSQSGASKTPPVSPSASKLPINPNSTSPSSQPSYFRFDQVAPNSVSAKEMEVNKWSNAQVVDWLKSVQLDEITALAKTGKWRGRVLVGLQDVRKDLAFIEHCKGLGLTNHIQQLEFRAELKILFG